MAEEPQEKREKEKRRLNFSKRKPLKFGNGEVFGGGKERLAEESFESAKPSLIPAPVVRTMVGQQTTEKANKQQSE
jgi:hypothetical protein